VFDDFENDFSAIKMKYDEEEKSEKLEKKERVSVLAEINRRPLRAADFLE
jgi:hypothetical protein